MKSVGCVCAMFLLVGGCSQSGGNAGPDPRASSSASGTATTAPADGIPELVSGVAIGPVRIGMTRKEIEALGSRGLTIKPGALGGDLDVGPYVASFEGDRVDSVHVELRALPAGVRVGGTVFVDGKATIETIAAKLASCGAVQVNTGANVISCDAGRTQVIAGGPPGIIAIQVLEATRGARLPGAPGSTASAGSAAPSSSAAPGAATSEATWTHPKMAMSFTYPDKLLRVSHKPDGATLQSDILGTIEDRSGQGKDRPSPLAITISIRTGKLLDVVKSHLGVQVSSLFPGGTEASFKEEKDFAARLTIAGNAGYRLQMGSHDAHQDLVFAPLPPSSTLEVVCSYVGDTAKPKVSMADQKKACDRVLSTLSIKL